MKVTQNKNVEIFYNLQKYWDLKIELKQRNYKFLLCLLAFNQRLSKILSS